MSKISRDIKQLKSDQHYLELIKEHLSNTQKEFVAHYAQMEGSAESEYSGLFCLLQIAKEPTQQAIERASKCLLQGSSKLINEVYAVAVFNALKYSRAEGILFNLLKFIKFYIANGTEL